MLPAQLKVTVVVCTRNRASDLPLAVHSVLASGHVQFELLVIDQSTDGASNKFLASITDPRLRVIKTETVGLSVARNIGLEAASTDLILMTDDDCVVSTTWIDDMCGLLLADHKVAALFGVVDGADCDESKGFVPEGLISSDRTFTSACQYDCRSGIGASLAFRRAAAEQVGGFDTQLGAGAPLKSAEELDFALRLLLAGHHVAHTTLPGVVHHGFRTFDEGRDLVRGYMLGTAAAHAKLMRLGHLSVVCSFARAMQGSFVPPVLSALRTRRAPPILGRFTSTARGLWIGFRTPTDPSNNRFLPAASEIGESSRS